MPRRVPPAKSSGGGAALLASLLAGNGLPVALLATLVLVTKTYFDFCRLPLVYTNAVLCDKCSGLWHYTEVYCGVKKPEVRRHFPRRKVHLHADGVHVYECACMCMCVCQEESSVPVQKESPWRQESVQYCRQEIELTQACASDYVH